MHKTFFFEKLNKQEAFKETSLCVSVNNSFDVDSLVASSKQIAGFRQANMHTKTLRQLFKESQNR